MLKDGLGLGEGCLPVSSCSTRCNVVTNAFKSAGDKLSSRAGDHRLTKPCSSPTNRSVGPD